MKLYLNEVYIYSYMLEKYIPLLHTGPEKPVLAQQQVLGRIQIPPFWQALPPLQIARETA